jgi:hypothetical protein
MASFGRLQGPKTFVFVGNIFNEGLLPGWLTLGLGKAATAHMVQLADSLHREDDER